MNKKNYKQLIINRLPIEFSTRITPIKRLIYLIYKTLISSYSPNIRSIRVKSKSNKNGWTENR